MSALPWVRFFSSDWLAGTRGLSAAESGVYISLIAMMYERGEPLERNDARLARLCGASNSSFKAALAILIDAKKISVIDGRLWNPRVAKEQFYRSEKSEVGKRAAETRWGKDQQNQRPADANAMRPQSEGNANQKPEPEKKDGSLREPRAREPEQVREVVEMVEVAKPTRSKTKPPEIIMAEKAVMDAFDEQFWPAYPHRVGLPAARARWPGAVKIAGGVDPIMQGLWRYIDSKPTDRQWLNPTTFLNQQRWADEPARELSHDDLAAALAEPDEQGHGGRATRTLTYEH